MTSLKFERTVLKAIASDLPWPGAAEWTSGTLFVTGIVPDEGRRILARIRDLGHRVRMTQSGSYHTDYTFAYDFVA